MNKLTITPPEGFEVDTVNSTFQEIVFKEIQNKYPISVKEIPDRKWYTVSDEVCSTDTDCLENVSSEERAKQFLALIQLVELCDAWNKADGEVIDRTSENLKYTINSYSNIISKFAVVNNVMAIAFGKEETRDLFLTTFPELLEQAQPLL